MGPGLWSAPPTGCERRRSARRRQLDRGPHPAEQIHTNPAGLASRNRRQDIVLLPGDASGVAPDMEARPPLGCCHPDFRRSGCVGQEWPITSPPHRPRRAVSATGPNTIVAPSSRIVMSQIASHPRRRAREKKTGRPTVASISRPWSFSSGNGRAARQP